MEIFIILFIFSGLYLIDRYNCVKRKNAIKGLNAIEEFLVYVEQNKEVLPPRMRKRFERLQKVAEECDL